MSVTRRVFLASAIRAAGGLALAGCAAAGPSAGASASVAGASGRGNITWGHEVDITNLEPFHSSAVPELQLYISVFDTVTHRDLDYKLAPSIAESWKLLNNTTWQFKIRPGVRFHNGDPLTADDVKFSMEYTRDPTAKSIYATSFATVASIDIVDRLTLNVVTKAPDPLIPDKLSMYPGYVIPKDHFQKVGLEAFNKSPVGSGPYQFRETLADGQIALEAYKGYWGTKANTDKLSILRRPDVATRVAGLKSGELDLIDYVPFDQVDDIEKSGAAKIVYGKKQVVDMFVLNAMVPPLDNKLVRQALSLATDRPTLNKSLYRGRYQIANSPLMPMDFAYDPALLPYSYDPNKAKALLQQAKYANEKVIIEYQTSTSGAVPQLEQAVAEQWKAAGLNVELRPMDAATRARKIASKTFLGTFTAGFYSLYGDPDGVLWRTLQPNGTLRYWSTPEFDKLGAEASTSVDQELRKRNYRRMVEIMIDEMPWISLWQGSLVYATSKKIDWDPGYAFTGEFAGDRLKFT